MAARGIVASLVVCLRIPFTDKVRTREGFEPGEHNTPLLRGEFLWVLIIFPEITHCAFGIAYNIGVAMVGRIALESLPLVTVTDFARRSSVLNKLHVGQVVSLYLQQ